MHKVLTHFHLGFVLPENSSLQPYKKASQDKNTAEHQDKLTKFSYYST